jgi:hypothetical protein
MAASVIRDVLDHRVRFDALLLYAIRHWPSGEAYAVELLEWLELSGDRFRDDRVRDLNRIRAGLYRLKADGLVVARFQPGLVAGTGIGRTYYRTVDEK